MNFVFLALGSLNLLPLAAQITAVALGGTAIGVMTVTNIIADIGIARRMFSAPGAYMHALTPAPRSQILLASVITMIVMDIVSMTVVIYSEVILALNLAGDNIWNIVWSAINSNQLIAGGVLQSIALMITGYLLVMMVIMFCITARKSIFYNVNAGGLLTAVLCVGVIYAISLSTLVLAPFGTVSRFGFFFTISLGGAGAIMYALLTLIQAAVLYIVTSKLMERKLNI